MRIVVSQVFLFRHIHVIHRDGRGNDIRWDIAKKLLENVKPFAVYETWIKGVNYGFKLKVPHKIRKKENSMSFEEKIKHRIQKNEVAKKLKGEENDKK